MLANRIFYLGATLPEFKIEIAVLVIFLLCVVLGPLLVFAPQLAQAKRTGLREYGTLAERYVREFDAKWLRGGAPADEPLVGSADIQSLADLGNSFEVVRTMRIAPVTKEAVLQLAAATLAPIVPLVLTMMPLEELLKKLFGIIVLSDTPGASTRCHCRWGSGRSAVTSGKEGSGNGRSDNHSRAAADPAGATESAPRPDAAGHDRLHHRPQHDDPGPV